MQPFDKHPETILHGDHPLNVETPLEQLRESFVTPVELFYVRNHGTNPEVDPNSFKLTISGMVEHPLELSLEDVRNEFPQSAVTAALHCAGNRREGLMEVAEIPGEVPWGPGAVGNAAWSGVPLREVLLAAGVEEGARHVAFSGLDDVGGEGACVGYGGSVPIEKGMSPEVLLAYEMNGEPLRPEHGFPLRVVVPGYIGARSVKWLSEITVQKEPSDNFYQQQSYRLLPPYVAEEPNDLSGALALGEISVNAAICDPLDGASLSAGPVEIKGYAIAGGGRSVYRVDLSVDGGRTWTGAGLSGGEDQPWAWRFWEAEVELDPGEHEIVVRALDSAADTQPESAASIWNVKGYVNNAWHRVRVDVR